MQKLDITLIINYLLWIWEIRDIFWNKIYYSSPDTEKSNLHLIINAITSRNPTNEWVERLEFRIICWESFNQLRNIDEIIFKYLQKYNLDLVYNIVSSNSFEYKDEKNKKCFLHDFIIKKLIKRV